MCGVSGIVSYEPADLSDAITRMVSVMHHRGPDGQGAFLDAATESTRLALGHNRLSILDLTDHAAQPMRSRDGRYRLVYNGEVYNYREIAQELDPGERPDVGFGDTAVVLAALVKWGPAALSKFNGMWAIVLYDAHEKTLLVSRDRFGVKPLYTYREGSRLYLASEVKAILAACGSRLAINPRVAVPYLTRGLLNVSDETFFEGIRQFPAASYQVIDLRAPGEAPIRRFWCHPVENGEFPNPGTVTPGELTDVFLDAVKLRLRSDVPVGILLSGGVDSSAILGGIAKLGALDNLHILSMTTGSSRSSEERFIDMMARHVAISPSKVNVSHDPIVLLERLSDACWFNDEPVYGIGNITHLSLMEVARSLGITVLLSGQGADEQLGGYNKFLYFWLMDLWRQGRRAQALATLAQSAIRSNTIYEFRLSEAIRYAGRKRLASDPFVADPFRRFDDLEIGMGTSYPERELADLTKLSIPALLHTEDRMSMSQSLEIRLPFLDFRLVERLARVHPSEKFQGGWSKSIFRKAIGGLVPKGIQYRRDKKGFTVPENAWLRGALKPHMLELFGSNDLMVRESGLVAMERFRELHARFLDGKGYLSGRPFFRVFALETFLRRFSASISV